MNDQLLNCETCKKSTLHRFKPSPEVPYWICGECGLVNGAYDAVPELNAVVGPPVEGLRPLFLASAAGEPFANVHMSISLDVDPHKLTQDSMWQTVEYSSANPSPMPNESELRFDGWRLSVWYVMKRDRWCWYLYESVKNKLDIYISDGMAISEFFARAIVIKKLSEQLCQKGFVTYPPLSVTAGNSNRGNDE